MSETHAIAYDGFSVETTLDDEGNVGVRFFIGNELRIALDFDEFREVIDFVCKHSLRMASPVICDNEDSKARA